MQVTADARVNSVLERVQHIFGGIVMKRDMVLARKLLEFIEVKGARLFKGSIIIEGYERDEVMHHLFLLVSAGFVELGEQTLADKGPLVLTWKGCDYLDALRAKKP